MIKIAFTGDILSYPGQNKSVFDLFGCYNYTSVFDGVRSLFDDCDYVCGSLETPVSPKQPYSKDCMNFNTPVEFLAALKKMGIDLLTTANNHCLDRGVSGLYETIDAIESQGMQSTGTRKNPSDQNYYIKTINETRLAFVAFTYDTNADANNCYLDPSNEYVVNLTKRQWRPNHIVKRSLKSKAKNILKRLYRLVVPSKTGYPMQPLIDSVSKQEIYNQENVSYLDNIKKTVAKAKEESDILFFMLHAGGQFNSEIGEYTRYLINYISNCGADFIICNHTHCVLPIDFDGRHFTAYSLGNFAFTPRDGYYIDGVYADYSAILYLTITDKVQLTPSFSIVKNILDQDGTSKVMPVYDLFNNLTDKEEKDRLLKDVCEVLKRLQYKGVFEMKKEYIIQHTI